MKISKLKINIAGQRSVNEKKTLKTLVLNINMDNTF